MAQAPLEITVRPNRVYGPIQNNGATPEQQLMQQGWNPLGLFQLPQFGMNFNMLWIFAFIAIVALLLTTKRK